MKKTLSPKEKLIFALDVNTIEDALRWVALLKDYVGLFKIGKEFFTTCGPDAVKAVHDQGGNVFLDLKFPMTYLTPLPWPVSARSDWG